MIGFCAKGTISKAVQVLKAGGLAAFPTETVYGLGTDAFDPVAVAKIFEVKKRPSFDPLIVHVSSIAQARLLWKKIPRPAMRLIKKFWPGPLTLVLPKTECVPDIVTAGLDTVAVRMPNHPVALELIRKLGRPIAAPSANRFGRVSPTTAEAVREELGYRVDVILDGGPCAVGVESTVVKIENGRALILRPGGISIEEIENVIRKGAIPSTHRGGSAEKFGGHCARKSLGAINRAPTTVDSSIQSPGQMTSHYATKTPLHLIDKSFTQFMKKNPKLRVALLAFGRKPREKYFKVIENLSPEKDLRQAAANLFYAMRKLDKMRLDLIAVERVPERGLGWAIMDRLKKASYGSRKIYEGK